MFDPNVFGERILHFETGERCYANAVPDINNTCRVHLYKLHESEDDIDNDGVCMKVRTHNDEFAYMSTVPIVSIGNVDEYYTGTGSSCDFNANGRIINIPIN